MVKTRICPGTKDERCGRLTTLPRGRCERHPEAFGARFRPGPPSPVYASRRWRKLRKQVIEVWVAEHGWTCPGWRKPPHPSRRLQVDHIKPLVAGGDAFDRANLRPLCPSCNARKSLHDRHVR